MKTVKQVSDLTGLSAHMLHYYDKIGLFKPSQVSESGYRLYNDDALEILPSITWIQWVLAISYIIFLLFLIK